MELLKPESMQLVSWLDNMAGRGIQEIVQAMVASPIRGEIAIVSWHMNELTGQTSWPPKLGAQMLDARNLLATHFDRVFIQLGGDGRNLGLGEDFARLFTEAVQKVAALGIPFDEGNELVAKLPVHSDGLHYGRAPDDNNWDIYAKAMVEAAKRADAVRPMDEASFGVEAPASMDVSSAVPEVADMDETEWGYVHLGVGEADDIESNLRTHAQVAMHPSEVIPFTKLKKYMGHYPKEIM